MKPIASLPSDASPSRLGSEQLRLPVENDRLAIESLAELRVCCERLRKNLDRNEAIEAGINGSVNLSHPVRADGGLLVRASSELHH